MSIAWCPHGGMLTCVEPTFETIIGREPRQLPNLDTQALNNSRILIIGGAGSIGFSLAKLLGNISSATIGLFDNDESRLHSASLQITGFTKGNVESGLIDIRDKYSVFEVFEMFKPNFVIHAAALKHVGVLEQWPRDGYLTNVLGTANVLSAVKEFQIKNFLFISTDKAVNPKSILGKTKLIGEYMTASLGRTEHDNETTSNIVRFGNVFLSRGSVMETFMFQISNKLPITISDFKATRFFIDLPEAAVLIINSMLTKSNKISILDMGEPVLIKSIIDKLKINFKSISPIIEIGLKKGEKLHEELFTDIDIKSDLLVNGVYSKNYEKIIDLDFIDRISVPSSKDVRNIIDEILKNAKLF